MRDFTPIQQAANAAAEVPTKKGSTGKLAGRGGKHGGMNCL